MSEQTVHETLREENVQTVATAQKYEERPATPHEDGGQMADAFDSTHQDDSVVRTYVSPAADEMLGEALEAPRPEGPHEQQLGRAHAQAMSFSSKAKDDSYYAGGNVTPESRFRELQRL